MQVYSPHHQGQDALEAKDQSMLDTHADFSRGREQLVTALDTTQALVGEFAAQNNKWTLRGSHNPLRVLGLERLETNGRTTAKHVLGALSSDSLGKLVAQRLEQSVGHMAALKSRVEDLHSRILVTGDLNSGKSTFVNALLRRGVMPTDQQPCTTAFSEVHSVSELPESAEEQAEEQVHAVKDGVQYNAADPSTYDVFSVDDLPRLNDDETYAMLKVYLKQDSDRVACLVGNSMVSVSLIDAPGLNRSTLQTTAVFAREAEIDIVVFVVAAENQLTLSAREFLQGVAGEKTHVFVVVNKWDQIKNKAKCERALGAQIVDLSPATWDARDELVHFVDALSTGSDAMSRLEEHLETFVLGKRTQSKLLPAKTYLLNVLNDVLDLVAANVHAAEAQAADSRTKLDKIIPIHEKLMQAKRWVDAALDRIEDSRVDSSHAGALVKVNAAMDAMRAGHLSDGYDLPAYRGLTDLFAWARDVQEAFVIHMESVIRSAEDDARANTVQGVNEILVNLSQKALEAAPPGVDLAPERTFMPQAMFAKRRQHQGRLAARGALAGLSGFSHLSLVAASSYNDVERLTPLDLVDLSGLWDTLSSALSLDSSLLPLLIGQPPSKNGTNSALGITTVSLTAMTLLGSRIFTVTSLVDAIHRVSFIAQSPAARKWAAPVLATLMTGLALLALADVPRAVPKNVGRRIAHVLENPPTSASKVDFAATHASRISREVRKVLRLAGWDLKERLRAALEFTANDRESVTKLLHDADYALNWASDYEVRVREDHASVSAIAL